MCKGFPTISGRGPTYVGCSTIKKTTRLEGGNNGIPKGKTIGFNHRFVHTISIGVRVTGDPGKRFIRECDQCKYKNTNHRQGERDDGRPRPSVLRYSKHRLP